MILSRSHVIASLAATLFSFGAFNAFAADNDTLFNQYDVSGHSSVILASCGSTDYKAANFQNVTVVAQVNDRSGAVDMITFEGIEAADLDSPFAGRLYVENIAVGQRDDGSLFMAFGDGYARWVNPAIGEMRLRSMVVDTTGHTLLIRPADGVHEGITLNSCRFESATVRLF